MLLTTVYTILSASTDVTTRSAGRIELLTKPKSIGVPSVCLFVVTTTPVNGLEAWNGLDGNLVQVDSYAPTYTDAKQLAQACRDALEAAGHEMAGEFDNFDDGVELTGLARVTQQYNVWS
jgi:hypothetical protein